jgi:general stress protein YciG
MNTNTQKKQTGFALFTPEQRKEMAKRGSAACAAQGKRYRFAFTHEQCVENGRLGGTKSQANARAKKNSV